VAEVSKKSKVYWVLDLLIIVIPPFKNLTHSPKITAMAEAVNKYEGYSKINIRLAG
jgi:hypothetical protein